MVSKASAGQLLLGFKFISPYWPMLFPISLPFFDVYLIARILEALQVVGVGV